MAKAKTYKCPVCGQPVLSDEAVPLKNRYLHQKCFNSQMKAIGDSNRRQSAEKAKKKTSKAKPLAELKEGMSEEEYQEKKRYYDKLKKLRNNDVLDVKDYKVSEDYLKKYSATWLDLYLTLCYIFDVKQRPVQGDCVGLIPFYFSEALRYYKELKSLEEYGDSLNNNKVSDLYKTQIIRIRPKNKSKSQIDISVIGGEEC